MKRQAVIPGMVLAGALLWVGCNIFIFTEQVQEAVEQARIVDTVNESTAGTRAIAVADFNNDGLSDVASISNESQPVQIHLRNPLTGLFDTVSIAGGAPLSSLVDLEAADFNRDGWTDLVVLVSDTGLAATSGKAALIFLFQTGGNTSQAAGWRQVPGANEQIPDKLTISAEVTDLVVGDMDGRNGPDIVVMAADGVRLFANPGDSEATDRSAWSATMIEATVAGAGRAALADLDHDGDQDVVMCDPKAKSFNLRWLQNPQIEVVSQEDPDPTFMADLLDPLFESTAGAKAAAVGDINGDGLLDVASASAENQPLQIHLRNRSTGQFDMYSIAGGGPLAKMTEVALDDLNGDGKLDVVVLVNDTGFIPPRVPDGVAKPGAVVLLIQGSDPTRPSNWTQVAAGWACYDDATRDECALLFPSDSTGVTDIAMADFTGDGLPDIVVASNEPSQEDAPNTFTYLLVNPGAASVSNPAAWNRITIEANVVTVSKLDVGDIDKDGDLDVLVGMPNSATWNLSWYANNGDGTSWAFRSVGQQEGGGDFVALGDVDEDGYLDVVASSKLYGLTQWFRNPGLSELTTRVPWYVFNIGELDDGADEISQLRLVDLDGDGHLETFVVGKDEIMGFRRETDVQHVWDSFAVALADPPEPQIGLVAFADFDADGKLDFVAPLDREGLTDDRLTMYTSVASSQWRRRLIGQQTNGANYVAVGDADGDGNTDVAAASASDALIQWFHNPGAIPLAYGAPQVPWDVFNIGALSDAGGSGPITQAQLVDLNRDGRLDCFATGGGYAFVFYPPDSAWNRWSGAAMFATDPVGEIGMAHFMDVDGMGLLDIVAPIDREGLTSDQIIIFYR